MYKNDKYNIKIEIDLPNGVYTFDNQSGTGKTYLFKTLRTYEPYEPDIVTYTYTDKLRGISLSSLIEYKREIKLLILDRYDMYNGDCTDIIVWYSKLNKWLDKIHLFEDM